MIISERIQSAGKKIMEKPPGMPILAAIVSAFVGILLQIEDGDLGLGTVVLVYVISYAFYRIGGFLDKPLFTPLYGTDEDKNELPWLWKVGTPIVLFPVRWMVDHIPPTSQLAAMREGARSALGVTETRGLYKGASSLFKNSPEWDDSVKPVLNVSKASRALVMPLILIAALSATGLGPKLLPFCTDGNANIILRVLDYPLAALILTIVSLFLFLYFRVWHMVTLYRLTLSSKLTFVACDAFEMSLATEEQSTAGVSAAAKSTPKKVLVAAGGRLVDATDVALFGPAISAIQQSYST